MGLRLLYCLLFMSQLIIAQDLARYNPIKAEVTGGADEVEQVLQTQLSFPKGFFLADYKDNLTVYFLIDSLGHARSISIHSVVPNVVAKKEMLRIMKFFHFQRTETDPDLPYYLNVTFSEDKYNSYQKQKFKGNLKTSLPADSSMIIYTRADKSPDYYKNGEEGLKELLLDNLEYPKIALEKSVEGTVLVEFVVETNGFITSIVPKQMLGAGCTEEALRLLKKTRWQPAQLNGKLVRYRMNYPITFSLRNVNHDTGFANPTVGQ